MAHALTDVIGRPNVASPTLSSLAGTFGLWPLDGKRLGVVADARLSGRADGVAVVERLLSFTGEGGDLLPRHAAVADLLLGACEEQGRSHPTLRADPSPFQSVYATRTKHPVFGYGSIRASDMMVVCGRGRILQNRIVQQVSSR
jgi:hypothetical protein